MFGYLKKLWGDDNVELSNDPAIDPAVGDKSKCTEPAAPPPPPPSVTTEGLDHFIADFLRPIAADGTLDPSIEETPLIVAYHVYGVDKLQSQNSDQLREKLCRAIKAAMRVPSRPSEEALADAWNRIRLHAASITATQYDGLRAWFASEATRLRYDIEYHDPDPMPEFSKEALSDSCLNMFHQLFHEISDALTIGDADEADPVDADAVTSADATEGESGTVVAPPIVAPPAVEPPDLPLPEVEVVEAAALPEAIAKAVSGELAEQLREDADEIVTKMEQWLEGDQLLGMAFDEFRSDRAEQAIIVPELEDDRDIWFVGDVHGDLLGLSSVLDYIDRTCADGEPLIVLLGDLFDDGKYSYETLLLVYERALRSRSRLCVIAGNHDDALATDDDGFRSNVWPSNFTEWLNTSDDEIARRAARAAVRLFYQAPRALFLPDGLIVAHGGVPHSDLQEQLETQADLNRDECLQDFVWTRLHDRAKRRIPNRTTRGCELGRQNFEGFCDKATELLGRPVSRMVRGHDHVDRRERFSVFSKYTRNHVLTINNMSCRLPREVFGPTVHVPCVGHWQPGALPTVHQVVIPDEAVLEMYPVGEE